MEKGIIAKAKISINVPIKKVWEALIVPEQVKQYMFGTSVESSWQEGASIVWKGEWQGKPYEDKGVIIKFEPEKLLVVTHFSPLSGLVDIPENYHTVSYMLNQKENATDVVLTQDNNASEEDKEHTQKNWQMVLAGLKKLLEK